MIGFGLLQRGGFSPRSLFRAGEAGVWYDPSDLASMAQTGDGTGAAAVDAPVGLIRDRSGRGNDAVQAMAAARPVLRRDSGGRHYLEFDGNDDYLRATFAIAQPFDRISGIRQLSYTQFDQIYDGATADAGNLYQDLGAPVLIARSGGTTNVRTVGAAMATNAVITERHNGASSRIAANWEAYITGDAGVGAPGGITIGASSTSGLNGHFRLYGLIMIGRALSDGEERRVRRFMASRAGAVL